MLEADRRDHLDSQKLRCFDSTMTGNDLIIAINQDRVVESELVDRPSDLVLLLVGMNTRVTRIRFERRNRALFHTQIS